MSDLLYGRNAVRESLRANRRWFARLSISAGAQEIGVLAEIIKIAQERDVPIERVDRKALDRQLHGANHQGVALEASDYPYVAVDECLALAEERREPALLLLLDHLQDPQNIGTLLRTAEITGVHGVLMPGRRASEVTPAVVNASSGATERLYISIVSNLAQTIVDLQRQGVWVVGVENDERAVDFDTIDLDMPMALVIGSEGSGLARLVRERCDFLVRLPMAGQIGSLNAAVAGSIVLYHIWRQRGNPSDA